MGVNFEEEKQNITDKLLNCGVIETQATITADVMVTADLYGVTSHGTRMLDSHINRISRGGYNLNPRFKHITETSSFAVIDADNAIGFVSADYCMRYAATKAKEVGVFTVFSRNSNTYGPAFYYPLQAAKIGLIGFTCCNSPAQMAPAGGIEKMLGTNPFSAVIPVPETEPIIIDMATSVVAKSKFKEYKEQGKLLPDGWALDPDGNPTNDPDLAMQGLVQPMAGNKGYAIAMLIDIFSGVLSGASFLNKVGRFYNTDGNCMDVGQMFVAVDPSIVLGDNYESSIKEFVKVLRNSKPIPGGKVNIPGDRKYSTKLKNKEVRK